MKDELVVPVQLHRAIMCLHNIGWSVETRVILEYALSRWIQINPTVGYSKILESADLLSDLAENDLRGHLLRLEHFAILDAREDNAAIDIMELVQRAKKTWGEFLLQKGL